MNPNGYQIISAGRDSLFGPGGSWNPAAGYTTAGSPGLDDLANFSQTPLGGPQK
jgi:hypothetical protein